MQLNLVIFSLFLTWIGTNGRPTLMMQCAQLMFLSLSIYIYHKPTNGSIILFYIQMSGSTLYYSLSHYETSWVSLQSGWRGPLEHILPIFLRFIVELWVFQVQWYFISEYNNVFKTFTKLKISQKGMAVWLRSRFSLEKKKKIGKRLR